jgi:hypothetical protein
MGVHTTFVRSVDLDEWTQRQVDAMRVGGNGTAQAYLRKHGFTDFHGKSEKKYKSKAAQSYRAELAKLVDAQAAQRGEGTPQQGNNNDHTNNLLANLELADQQQGDALARQKLQAARAAAAGPVKSNAVLASQLPGAKKLVTPPGSGGVKLVLRKPAGDGVTTSTATKNLLKKKSSNVTSKLRINKLAVASVTHDADDFEDVEATQIAAASATQEAEQVALDAALAKSMMRQQQLEPQPVVPVFAPPTAVSSPPSPPKPVAKPAIEKKASMEDHMARMKAMNGDFFGGM